MGIGELNGGCSGEQPKRNGFQADQGLRYGNSRRKTGREHEKGGQGTGDGNDGNDEAAGARKRGSWALAAGRELIMPSGMSASLKRHTPLPGRCRWHSSMKRYRLGMWVGKQQASIHMDHGQSSNNNNNAYCYFIRPPAHHHVQPAQDARLNHQPINQQRKRH